MRASRFVLKAVLQLELGVRGETVSNRGIDAFFLPRGRKLWKTLPGGSILRSIQTCLSTASAIDKLAVSCRCKLLMLRRKKSLDDDGNHSSVASSSQRTYQLVRLADVTGDRSNRPAIAPRPSRSR